MAGAAVPIKVLFVHEDLGYLREQEAAHERRFRARGGLRADRDERTRAGRMRRAVLAVCQADLEWQPAGHDALEPGVELREVVFAMGQQRVGNAHAVSAQTGQIGDSEMRGITV